ncbi:origin recognition complex subunit 1 [Aphelenchoides avenae]|nr:origin recognition complex subunit 1 [Aphelenchus avenae]
MSPTKRANSASRKKGVKRQKSNSLEEVKEALHTSIVPDHMPCRDKEVDQVKWFFRKGINEHKSQVLYVSGVPGTGKTATVLKVVRDLEQELPGKFTFIYANALEFGEPKQIFPHVCMELQRKEGKNPKSVSATTASQRLRKSFGVHYRNRLPIFILVDEMDMVCTKKQDIIYEIVNWCSVPEAGVNVIGISNTLDLPERIANLRVGSRMGSNRIFFHAYQFAEMETIIAERLKCGGVNQKAVEYAARKVANLTGDLRKALDILRSAVDFAIEQNVAQVGMEHVNQAMKEANSSVRVEMCLALSLHEQLIFRAAVRVVQKAGIDDDFYFSELLDQYRRICIALKRDPLGQTAAFRIVMKLSSSQLLIVCPGIGEMRRNVRLGFSQPEAEFCLRRMDEANEAK